MKSKLQKDNKGFTIIEVLIVLAIAGLILLIVFLAVPALQRNSRNTQRKNDVSAFLGAVSEYNSNKNGKNPGYFDTGTGELLDSSSATAGTGVKPKLGLYQPSEVEFGSGNTAITSAGPPPVTPDQSKIYIRTGAKCNASFNDFGGSGATSRNVAVVYTIETTSGTSTVCQES